MQRVRLSPVSRIPKGLDKCLVAGRCGEARRLEQHLNIGELSGIGPPNDLDHADLTDSELVGRLSVGVNVVCNVSGLLTPVLGA